MKFPALSTRGAVAIGAATLATAAAATVAVVSTASASPDAPRRFVLGVSNTLVGNGWREEMICSIKAQARASGRVSRVVVVNENAAGAADQIGHIRRLISAGVNAIIINPVDRDALNPIIEQAAARGIVVVAVDQAVSTPKAYVATNNQVAYGRIGMAWLAKKLKGRGRVVEMRGIAGVPADTDRHNGVRQALRRFKQLKVAKQTFTGWVYATGGKQMLDLLNSGVKFNGVWTSGIDYTVVNAFRTAKKKFVPVVGSDNNAFLGQLLKLRQRGLVGAAVTNPATIGGVGASIALKVLTGKKVPRRVTLKPEVWDNTTKAGLRKIRRFYSQKRAPNYSSQLFVKPWTTYTEKQLVNCQGP
jgi:ribose transport system substrate-binding protein